MIASQFAAEALQNPGHPFHVKTKIDSSTRQVRKSLREHPTQYCQKLLLEPTYKKEEIHRETVQHVVENLTDNKVLNDSPPVPPDVLMQTERELTRSDEVTLCQLRSGYSSKLNSYLSRIDSKKGYAGNAKKSRRLWPHDEMSPKSRTGRPVDGPCSCVQRPGHLMRGGLYNNNNNNTSDNYTSRLCILLSHFIDIYFQFIILRWYTLQDGRYFITNHCRNLCIHHIGVFLFANYLYEL